MRLPEAYAPSMPTRVSKATFQKQMLREDWAFLRRILMHVHDTQKAAVKRQYRVEFVKAYNAEPALHRKPNAGRRAANSWLNQYYLEHCR